MEYLIFARNILVPVAIGMWVIIGLVALIIFLKNKFSGSRKSLKPGNNEYKETFVQNHNTSAGDSLDDSNGSNGNKGGSSLCL